MPAATRFAFLRDTLRNHPVIVASTAATAGVLVGAFVAVQLLDTPQPRPVSVPAPQAAAETKAAPKPVAETTGSAPTGETVTSAECEQQTWPYLSRACIAEMRIKNRMRLISTDRLDKPTVAAIEAPAPAAEIKPASPASAMPTPAPAAAPVAAAVAVFAAPESSPAALTAGAQDAQALPRAAAKPEAKKETGREKRERIAKKSKKKPKFKTKIPPRPEAEDDDGSVASVRSDDRADYDIPSYDGRGQRRVTVIRRGGGGVFESLFGN
jgi:hypothetical protein